MIEAKRRRGWHLLWGAIGCILAMFALLNVLDRSRADLVIVCLWIPAIALYSAGLYFLVKARGRHGAWALLGAFSWVGWILIARLQDLSGRRDSAGGAAGPASPDESVARW